jgi:hypothetical protein
MKSFLRHCMRAALAIFIGVSFAVSAAFAWPHTTAPAGLPVAGSVYDASAPVSDGIGGVFFVFYRYSSSYDLYLQHVDAAGNSLLGAGVLVCNAAGDQTNPVIASDSFGGCLVAWLDRRNYATTGVDIYAQEFASNGAAAWTANGVPVCTAANDQTLGQIASDLNFGAYVSWVGSPTATLITYVQHLNSSGAPTGPVNGTPVVSFSTAAYQPSMVVDLSGYCDIAWSDYRSGTSDIYMQRFAQNLAAQYVANGIGVCTATGYQLDPAMRCMPDGNLFVAWDDARSFTTDIYAQRVSTLYGGTSWAANGIPLCTAVNGQANPMVVASPSGDAVVAWADYRNTGNVALYAQRVDMSGATQWNANGNFIMTTTTAPNYVKMAPDAQGNTLFAWADTRQDSNGDIYAQRLSPSGYQQWFQGGNAGVVVANGRSFQYPDGICTSGTSTGMFMTLYDTNAGGARIQYIDEWGSMGAEPAMAGVRDIPNDQGGQVKVSWYASPLDTDPVYRTISDYVLYRSVPTRLANALAPSLKLGTTAVGGKRYLRTRTAAQDYFWEELAHVVPRHLASYSYVAATTGDSVGASNPRTAFMVMALANSGTNWWTSNPDSGFSVDNIPPAAPAPLTGQYGTGRVALHWDPNTDADVAGYRIYRGTTPGFAIGAGTLVAAKPDTGLVDLSAVPAYYKVTAIDTHGNESAPASLLPAGTLAVGDAPLHASFSAPAPNPLRGGGASLLRFTLAQAGRTRLALYDAQGRLVRTLSDGALEAGAHAVRFDGRDDSGRALAPGLYLARIAAPGLTGTQRLLVIE